MKMTKIVSIALALNCISVALLLLGYFTGLSPTVILIVFAFIEIIITTGEYILIVRPMYIFEKAVDHCIKNDMEKSLDNLSDHIIFVKNIKSLAETYSNQKMKENYAEMFDKQAELAALQSQINPHFLYNTLESIRGQALIDDNADIAKMVEALAAFFRYSISRKAELVTLRDELANIQNYMMILRYRFNNRFSLEIIIDDEDKKAYDYFIPKLILQPVVENAIFHGLEECLEGGLVTIEVIETENSLILTVSDNGKGMDNKTLSDINKRIRFANEYKDSKKDINHRNTGIALPNIHKRIQLLFGEEYGVNVYSTLNQGTDVEITIPTHYERNAR